MLAYLSGKIIYTQPGSIIVKLPAGIGYLVNVSTEKNFMVNENVELFLYEVKREDKNELYGFGSPEEKNWYEKLLKVAGVGPKSAASIVFSLGINKIAEALRIGDPKVFSRVKGLGAKTAKKIVLELKGELIDSEESHQKGENSSYFTSEFVDTLSGLGYKRGEIVAVISKLKKNKLWVETDIVETVKQGLKAMGR